MKTLSDFAATLAGPVVSHVWSSTLFLALVLVLFALLRHRFTAAARFALVTSGIAKFALPAALFAPLGESIARNLASVQDAALQLPIALLGGTLVPDATASGTDWRSVAMILWFAVALLLILRYSVIRYRLVALALRTATPPLPREVDALSRARKGLGVHHTVDLARSATPEAPAVLRVFRPLVVLPLNGCDELSDHEAESLLRHECAHVVRYDNLVARIESLICAVFWFHPLLWIARRITAIERERACDEVVARSEEERDAYLTALAKFCHAAIVPRLPGVSCMATANLKERMDHVMNYPTLKRRSPSAMRTAFVAAIALVLFTAASGIVGETATALAASGKTAADRFAVRVEATQEDDAITVRGRVSENATQRVIAAPTIRLDASRSASTSTTTDGLSVRFEVRPAPSDRLTVEITIEEDGTIVQRSSARVKPAPVTAAASSSKYTGEPISLELFDAELRDVIGTFGRLTGMEMKIADDVQGKVSVAWKNVPWDQAFDELLAENGLTYKIDGSTIHVSKK